jgi:uncharacterized membrane protein
MFNLFSKKPQSYFTEPEQARIVEAIKSAEMRTSGEVRIYIENKCRFMNPVHRAQEMFYKMGMQETAAKNAVLVYVAIKDKQLAVFGDAGIHEKVGSAFWEAEVQKMLEAYKQSHYAEGLANMITAIGEALKQHFPYDAATDKNELSDNIVFG